MAGLVTSLPNHATAAESLLSPALAERMGLTEVWRRALATPAGAQSIVDQKILVDRDSPHRFVEIVRANGAAEPEQQDDPAAANGSQANGSKASGEVLSRLRVDQLDRFGNPISEDEAKRLSRNEIRKLQLRGIEATIAVQDVPSVLLYTLSNDGSLECRDAETGQSRWLARVGDRQLGYGRMGADANFISVINGGNLLLIDAATGSLLSQRRTTNVPGAGTVHVADYVVIPSLRSGLEGHLLSDPDADPFLEQVSGISIQVPTWGPGTRLCAWGTDNEYVYVMELEGEPSVMFRLKTDGRVNARIAAVGDHFYFATDRGHVYALQGTRLGKVLWSRPFGEPFYNPPSLHQGRMLLRSSYGNLYSLDADTGEKMWPQPVSGVDEILAVTDGRIFIRKLSGHLAALDLETGDRVLDVPEIQPTHLLINRETNRLYLLTASGTVQCLRPLSSDLPEFESSATPLPRPSEEQPAELDRRRPAGPARQPDPFGAEDTDPFAPAGDDPFDPFDTGQPMTDPFGSGGL